MSNPSQLQRHVPRPTQVMAPGRAHAPTTAAPREEHCDACQVVFASRLIVNVECSDGRFRALCPECRREA